MRVSWVQRAQMDGGDIPLTGFVDSWNIISLQHIQSQQKEKENSPRQQTASELVTFSSTVIRTVLTSQIQRITVPQQFIIDCDLTLNLHWLSLNSLINQMIPDDVNKKKTSHSQSHWFLPHQHFTLTSDSNV